jgi:hypothetical protein
MSTKSKHIIFHIIGCIIFLSTPVLLFTHPPGEKDFLYSRGTQRDFIANGLMLIFFYVNYFLLIPRVYFNKKYFGYWCCVAMGFVLICLLPSLITGRNPLDNMPPPPGSPMSPPAGSTFLEEIRHHVYLFITVSLFSLFLRIRERWFLTERARYNAELSYLKAQINPHFLFNTLNSIYALAVTKDDRTADAVINLSGLMRYIIKDVREDKVPLEKELDYINNYLDLQRSRLRDTADIDFTLEGDAGNKTIAPLILITFIENAFKYGINPDEDSPVRIHISITDMALQLEVFNRKVRKTHEHSSTGIGLENTKERLQLLYPGRHTLHITENDEHFSVHLTITFS